MRAGSLRHRGTIQSPTVTADTLGGDTIAWTNFANRVPMEVVQSASRELWNAQQTQPDITCLVNLRWMPGVTTGMRVLWHDGATDRVLNIDGPPLEDGRRESLTLTCIEPK